MRKSRFSDQQIALALQQVEHGLPVAKLCRKLGISEQTFYRWKKKFGEMAPSEIKKLKKLKQLEEENRRLKNLVADLTLDKQILREVLRKKTEASRAASGGSRSSVEAGCE
jgi:putative transposase